MLAIQRGKAPIVRAPLSVVEQPPETIPDTPLWALSAEPMCRHECCRTDNNEVKLRCYHNSGWGSFNRAINSEYQMHLLLNDYAVAFDGGRVYSVCGKGIACHLDICAECVDCNCAGVVRHAMGYSSPERQRNTHASYRMIPVSVSVMPTTEGIE